MNEIDISTELPQIHTTHITTENKRNKANRTKRSVEKRHSKVDITIRPREWNIDAWTAKKSGPRVRNFSQHLLIHEPRIVSKHEQTANRKNKHSRPREP